MRRALFLALLAAVLAAGVCFAQTKKDSNTKPAARQELSIPPVAAPNAPAGQAHPNPYNVYNSQYPRIEADNRVTFHFTAPNAQKVQVALVTSGQGSLSPLPYDMVKGADGVWTYTSVPQGPGYHNYWMLVDGSIALDPATRAFMGYSHMCNGYEIPEAGVDWYDLKEIPHGDVAVKNYFSKTSNSWRRIFVYTPPGYAAKANIKTLYPVVYLQHGSGEDESVWFEMGRTNLILDNLLAAGKVKPMIVVSETSMNVGAGGRGAAPAGGTGRGAAPGAPGTAPAAGAGRGAAPGAAGTAPAAGAGRGGGFGGGAGGGAYGQLMVNDLIPWVDSHYRTLSDKNHRAMGGLSMGGGVTASVTMVNLDKFSYIGLFSGGSAAGFGGGGRGGAPGATPAAPAAPAAQPPTLDLKTIYSGAMADPVEFNRKVKVLFMTYGTEPPLENPEGLKRHQDQLIAAGIKNSYIYLSPGTTHEWQTWRRSFYTFAQLLFK
jgi:enterochelin esterase-like enzyme